MIFWARFSGWNLLLLKMWWKVNVQLLFRPILKGKLGYTCCSWTSPFWNKYKQKITKETCWIKHLGSFCFNFSNKSMITNASIISWKVVHLLKWQASVVSSDIWNILQVEGLEKRTLISSLCSFIVSNFMSIKISA